MASVNIKNPAIKRIHADVRELMKDPSDQYHAAPLESNLFEWHFTLRGPPDTEFEGGVYHGRILLPPEYPFKPPDIVFMTPNGRFKDGLKICLTISSYHPECWQPAWGIRLILEALISFFPTPSEGAYGGLDWSKKDRKALAAESHEWKCYRCGHAKALLPELRPKREVGGDGKDGSGGGDGKRSGYLAQIQELMKIKPKSAEEIAAQTGVEVAADRDGGGGGGDAVQGRSSASRTDPATVDSESGNLGFTSTATEPGTASPARNASPAGTTASPGAAVHADNVVAAANGRNPTNSAAIREGGRSAGAAEGARNKREKDDELLTYLAVAIAMAIAGIILRKFLRYFSA